MDIFNNQTYYFSYLHLQNNNISVQNNTRVEVGTLIGLSGSTGAGNSEHLHVETRTRNGVSYYFTCDEVCISDSEHDTGSNVDPTTVVNLRYVLDNFCKAILKSGNKIFVTSKIILAK